MLHPDATELTDPPPPLPPSDDEVEVDFLLYEFEQAASGEHTAWAMSGAICRLQNAYTRSTITPRERNDLLRALFAAHRNVIDSLDSVLGRELIVRGLDAVAGLIVLWGETAEERAVRPTACRRDIDRYARILRNACHNASLIEELAQDASMLSPDKDKDCERERAVERLARELAMIARGAAVAPRAVTIIDTLQRRAEYGTITAEQRDWLLQAFFAARAHILDLFRAPDARAHATNGLDAVAALIHVWGETADEIKAQPRNTYAIFHDTAEILRSVLKIRVCSDNLSFLANEHGGAFAGVH